MFCLLRLANRQLSNEQQIASSQGTVASIQQLFQGFKYKHTNINKRLNLHNAFPLHPLRASKGVFCQTKHTSQKSKAIHVAVTFGFEAAKPLSQCQNVRLLIEGTWSLSAIHTFAFISEQHLRVASLLERRPEIAEATTATQRDRDRDIDRDGGGEGGKKMLESRAQLSSTSSSTLALCQSTTASPKRHRHLWQ